MAKPEAGNEERPMSTVHASPRSLVSVPQQPREHTAPAGNHEQSRVSRSARPPPHPDHAPPSHPRTLSPASLRARQDRCFAAMHSPLAPSATQATRPDGAVDTSTFVNPSPARPAQHGSEDTAEAVQLSRDALIEIKRRLDRSEVRTAACGCPTLDPPC